MIYPVAKNGLAAAALVAMCECASAQSAIIVLSTRADSVSGGDAVVQVRAPAGVAIDQVTVARNGTDVTRAFVAADAQTLQGLVGELVVGANFIVATTKSGEVLGRALVQNWPIYGPIFAGPHQRPWICETEASGLGPPPADGPCVAPVRYEWFYRTTAGMFQPLPSPQSRPPDVAQTTTIDGRKVDYIVRVESGVIDESIYRIAIIDDPTHPIANPWSAGGTRPGPGWNGKLFYHFIGGCRPGFRSGRNVATDALNITDTISVRDEPLSLGFAVAFGTRNRTGHGCDDVISAETVMMIKERFIEQYGVPKFTIGLGSSGAAMQQHLIAHNYPGLLDAITPVRSFPDVVTVLTDVIDCGLLINYFDRVADPAAWPGDKRSKVDGHPVDPEGHTNCEGSNETGRVAVVPTGFFDAAVPLAARYDRVTNRTGARGTLHDGMVNVVGVDPATGFARRPYDNVGVQYGLRALNAGEITKAEFLDLNEKIGGLDVDGEFVAERSAGDLEAIAKAYETGRVNDGANVTLPIIQYRNYMDFANDIHTSHRSSAMIARLEKTNGTAGNLVRWTMPADGKVNFMRMALIAQNEWLESIAADRSADPYPVKVIRNKPASLTSACWDENAVVHEEQPANASAGVCEKLFPVHANPRIAAGGPIAGDVLKCQLKRVTMGDYAVKFTAAERALLQRIFPQGVCDWSRPGVSQQPMTSTWLRYEPVAQPGGWVVRPAEMGRSQ
jgi:hypothetical protein